MYHESRARSALVIFKKVLPFCELIYDWEPVTRST
jgi:hypothetical protein